MKTRLEIVLDTLNGTTMILVWEGMSIIYRETLDYVVDAFEKDGIREEFEKGVYQ